MQGILETLQDPHARHAMLVHFPIVLALVGIVPLIIHLAMKARSRGLGLALVAWYAAASIGAALAANSGEAAEEGVEALSLTPAEQAALERHEELGENGWIWPLIPAAFAAATLVPRPRLRIAAGGLAIAAGAGVAVWVGATAHAGGELVYKHGLGVPARGAAPITVPRTQTDDDED
ncbi:MAG TPA: hypothetical protein PLU35_08300 [Phycisphaerales bacterium]|nr:hypothetical protein [Phycisphaerales bacterium]